MSSQGQSTEELIERIRRLESLAAGRHDRSGEVTRVRPEGGQRTDIRSSDFSAQSVNTSGRDMYVVQLEERLRFLEGLDRAHRMRRTFFMLSAACFIAAMAVAVHAAVQINDLTSSTDLSTASTDLPSAFHRYMADLVAAVALEAASIAFLIFGLFSRPPRAR